jgi:hypothetical protein
MASKHFLDFLAKSALRPLWGNNGKNPDPR